MTDNRASNSQPSLMILLNRVCLGLYFVLAGVTTIRDGVGYFYLNAFLPLKPEWLPQWFAQSYGYALPYAEIVVGALLAVGLRSRLSAALTVLILLSSTVAIYATGNFHGLVGPFHTNIILASIAAMLFVTGPGAFSVDTLIVRHRRNRLAKAVADAALKTTAPT